MNVFNQNVITLRMPLSSSSIKLRKTLKKENILFSQMIESINYNNKINEFNIIFIFFYSLFLFRSLI